MFVARDFFQFHRAAHTDGAGLAGASASGGGAAASLCGDYPKGPVCVNTTSTLDRRRVLAVIAFNRDLIGPAAPQVIPPIGAEGLSRRPPAGSCRLFLGPGFRLPARWNRLGETVKMRKKREKTGEKWARYGLRSVNHGS